MSIAAGPVGRNAEAAGAASLKGVAGVFSYSKTKGLFAGVSIEGSILIERRDANEKLYSSRITARQLLEGAVRPPPEAEPLMRVLNSRVFASVPGRADDSIYNDIPVYDEGLDSPGGRGRSGSQAHDGYEYRDKPQRASTWQDDVYDRQPASASSFGASRANPTETFDSMGSRRGTVGTQDSLGSSKPSRPTVPKPQFKARPSATSIGKDQAVALFTFDATQEGDLGFKKGDVITIVKRTNNATDWWTGRIGGKEGIFPRYCFHSSITRNRRIADL